MRLNLDKILKYTLFFGAIYFLVEGFLFFFHIRLSSVETLWPASALDYIGFISQIFAIFLFLFSAWLFKIWKNPRAYAEFIALSAQVALLLGVYLLTSGLVSNYQESFKSLPSLYVNLPSYNLYLVFEGLALVAYSLLVYFWLNGSKPNTPTAISAQAPKKSKNVKKT